MFAIAGPRLRRRCAAAVLACAVLACAGLAGNAAAAEANPLRDFAAHPDFVEVRLSPDGEHLAAIMRDDERSKLVVLRTATLETAAYLQLDAYDHFDDLWWAAPRRLVMSVSRQPDAWAQPRPTGELLAVDADGRNAKYLFGARAGQPDKAHGWMIDALAGDDRHVLVLAEPHNARSRGEVLSAYKVDVDTGTRVKVATAPAKGWADFTADDSGRVLWVRLLDGEGRRHLYTRDSEQAAWRVLPMAPGTQIEVRRVFADGTTLQSETSAQPAQTCVLRRTAGSAQGGALLGCTPRAGALLYSFDRREPIALRAVEQGRARIRYLASGHADSALLQALERELAPDAVLYLDYTRDGSHALIKVISDRDPGSYYLYERAKGKARRLLSSRDAIDPARMAPRHYLEMPGASGNEHAYLTLPAGVVSPPLVVKLKGVFGVSAGWTWNADAQLLASRGYAVLDIDSYDAGQRSTEPAQPAAPDPALALADSLIANLQWLRARQRVDPHRICIHGDSYGVYVALTAAVRAPQLFRCIVAEAGIVDIDAWRRDSHLGQSAYGRSLIELYMTGSGRARSSPLMQLDRLQAPLLLVHGRLDTVVPYDQARLLMKTLERHDRPYEKYIENDEAHGFYREAHRVARYERLLGFFDRHLGAAGP